MNITRYARIENSPRPREIVLLKAFPCQWGRCSFCDYIHDNSADESEMNSTNAGVLRQVTGDLKALQVINSGSCFEIPAASLQLIKETVQRCQVQQLYFEAHWSYRHRLDEMRRFFGLPIIFITGVETFDDHFRNQVLKKGMIYRDIAEIRQYFASVCLMIGMQGQTREMISNDVKIAIENFDYVTINLFVDNSTGIKADLELQAWFKCEFAWLQQHEKVDILFENTDFGVGAAIQS
ncbi:MAG: radical SAM protein [Candidatus Riflebacteria bacterium]|nr:radical SAM protein [Candidatus Riflebacteria bacterium]